MFKLGIEKAAIYGKLSYFDISIRHRANRPGTGRECGKAGKMESCEV